MGAVVYLGNHQAIERKIRYTQDPAHRGFLDSTLDGTMVPAPAEVIGPDGSEWWPETNGNGSHVHNRVPLPGKQCTELRPPDDLTYAEIIHDLTHADGIWRAHSDAETPAWVASTDPKLADLLGALFDCEVRDVEDGEQ